MRQKGKFSRMPPQCRSANVPRHSGSPSDSPAGHGLGGIPAKPPIPVAACATGGTSTFSLHRGVLKGRYPFTPIISLAPFRKYQNSRRGAEFHTVNCSDILERIVAVDPIFPCLPVLSRLSFPCEPAADPPAFRGGLLIRVSIQIWPHPLGVRPDPRPASGLAAGIQHPWLRQTRGSRNRDQGRAAERQTRESVPAIFVRSPQRACRRHADAPTGSLGLRLSARSQ
jgi:hypothetical protein